jgi:aryl-alcohol dehydrogenase-like predicted oxidoreductase
MPRPNEPLSSILPPLICGTATFNSQYNPDPYTLPTTAIVHHALRAGLRAFDTSPYYGPAEELLGHALSTPFVRNNHPRHTYQLLTKVGRIASSTFDYSPSWIRKSIRRSLHRLHTTYLDLVYCHDVEFVSANEVLTAVRELRRIRDESSTIKYVGISGYPIPVLCSLSEMILRETGEPLDAVMSYANFTLQNTRLLSEGLPRLLAAGVDVVPNASPLGMGLLRRHGVPIGSMGDFHPAPNELRVTVQAAATFADKQGEKLEVLAIRYALESWLQSGSPLGSHGEPLASEERTYLDLPITNQEEKLGVSVMGVSNLEELYETIRVWRSILDGQEKTYTQDSHTQLGGPRTGNGIGSKRDEGGTLTPSDELTDREWSHMRRDRIQVLATGVREVMGEWVDFAWESPGPGFVNVPLPKEEGGWGMEVDGGEDESEDEMALPSQPTEEVAMAG